MKSLLPLCVHLTRKKPEFTSDPSVPCSKFPTVISYSSAWTLKATTPSLVHPVRQVSQGIGLCSCQSSLSFSKRQDSLKCTHRLSELGFQKLCYLIQFLFTELVNKKKKSIYPTQCALITLFQQDNHAGLLEGFIKCSLLYFLPLSVLLFSENSCV